MTDKEFQAVLEAIKEYAQETQSIEKTIALIERMQGKEKSLLPARSKLKTERGTENTAAVPLSLLFYHGGKKMTRGKELWKGIKLRESAGMIRRLRGHGWRRV